MDRDAVITAAYRRLASRPGVVRAALRARNVSTALIGHHVAAGIDPVHNGERLLAETVAPNVRTLVDVGANAGAYTAMLLGLARADVRALLFEPSPHAVARLHRRFAGDPRVEVTPVALGDVAGPAVFHQEGEGGESSSLVPGTTGGRVSSSVVEVRTLDAELERAGVEHVDLLKVDAEGFDLRVLKGAARALGDQRVSLVQFEYNVAWAAAGSTLTEARTWLADRGHEVLLLRPGGLFELEHEQFGEFGTYANFVAVGARGAPLVAGLRRGRTLARSRRGPRAT